ncbi:MAG TPA: hypothetical protein PKK10_05225 [Woeseiaceae bacterium]|nr:hypothetical protein [Woeseiaceae bacterium]
MSSLLPSPNTMMASIVACVLLQACSSGSDAPPPSLPTFFSLEGAASTKSGEEMLDCHIDFMVELSGETLRSDSFVEYSGSMGGQAGRKILNPDGSGISLAGDAFSNVRVRLTYPDIVLIESINVPGPPADPPDFWTELLELNGRLGPKELISGDWLCAPFFTEIGGIDDSFLFADGSWFTTPLSNP